MFNYCPSNDVVIYAFITCIQIIVAIKTQLKKKSVALAGVAHWIQHGLQTKGSLV